MRWMEQTAANATGEWRAKMGGDDGVVVGVLGIGRRKREKVHAVSEKML